MYNWNKTVQLPIFLTLAALFAACGGPQTTASSNINPATLNPSSLIPAPVLAPTPTTSPSPSTGSAPPINSLFKLTGPSATYTSAPVNTDSILKVTVTSAAPGQVGTTGYTDYYSCLQFNVSVNSEVQQVTLSYGNPPSQSQAAYYNVTDPCGGGVPNSATLDFSDQCTPGHPALDIVVSQPEYDNCRTSGGYGYGITGSLIEFFYPGTGIYFGGCPMTAVYSTHSVSGTLAIHTNKTQ